MLTKTSLENRAQSHDAEKEALLVELGGVKRAYEELKQTSSAASERLAAVIVAASFATFENICFLTQNGADQILFLLIRGFGTGAMHVVCGNVYGGALRPVWDSRPLRAACLFALLCVAIIYHAIYNLLVSAGGTPQLIAYFVPLPTALCFRLLARKAEA